MIKIMPIEDERPFTRVDNRFFLRYLPLAPESYSKVYLYGLMLSEQGAQSFDLAGALGMREAEVKEALLYWQSQGLLRLLPGNEPCAQYLPISENGRAKSETKGSFTSLFSAVQECFGSRLLSAAELEKVRDWVEVYGLSKAAVLMLVQSSIQSNERGTGVSFRYLDEAARAWAEMDVKSAEAAEAYLQARGLYKSGAMAVLKRLNKQRPPTQDELNLYENWVKDGFDEGSILLACSFLTAYGTPSFKALDGILCGCKSRGLSTQAAMEEYLKLEEQEKSFARDFFARLGMNRDPSRVDHEQLYVWRSEWHMSDALILLAADSAFGEAQRMAAARRLIKRWHERGIGGVDEAKADMEQEKNTKKQDTQKKSKSFVYMQRESPVDADSFILNLDDKD